MTNPIPEPGEGDFWATSPVASLQSLLDAIGTAVFVIGVGDDGSYTVECVNHAYARVFGVQKDAIAGRRLDELMRTEGCAAVAVHYDRCIAAGAFIEYDEEIELDGTLFYARTTLTPFHAGGRAVRLIGTSVDLTDRYAMELELQTARDRAEIATRAKSEFMANMSHELRTPLNAVIGYSELMETEAFGPLGSPKYAEYAGDIAFAGRHLLDIINDILDLARVEAGAADLRETAVRPDAIVEEVARLAPAHDPARAAEVDIGRLPQDVTLRVDRRLIRQALLNLVANALKFHRPGSVARIGADLLADGQLCFHVSDTGRGIAATDLPVALAPFGRIESAATAGTQGAGLGLPITRAIVESHGGALFINSERDVGTTVFLALPADRVDCPEGRRPPATIAGLKDYFRFDAAAVVAGAAASAIDELPIGAILLDPQGKVLRYNAVEAGFSEMRPDRVTGRNFFREVAPCTFTDDFHGRFADVSTGRSPGELFSFVFTLRRPWKVLVEMRPGSGAGSVWLFVRWV